MAQAKQGLDKNANKKKKKKKMAVMEGEGPSKQKKNSTDLDAVLVISSLLNKSNITRINSSPAVIPYHFTLSTGVDRDASTTARAYVIITGPNEAETDRLWLDPPGGKRGFQTGTMDHFVCYAADVGEIKRVEVRIWDCLLLQ